MFPLAEFRDCLERVAGILRSQRIGFYLTGGAAFIAYGDPRTTQDVDFVIDAGAVRERVATVIDLCRSGQFLLSEPTIREAVRTQRQFQLIDSVSTLKIDLYPRELVAGSIERSIEVEVLPGRACRVASRPDLVASSWCGSAGEPQESTRRQGFSCTPATLRRGWARGVR